MAFNNLTDAEAERLAILAEELGEAMQAIGKILRHGYDSMDPTSGTDAINNRDDLVKELGDIEASIVRMVRWDDIDYDAIMARATHKLNTQQYLHHQAAVSFKEF